MKYYISGPMTGYADHNFSTFVEAEMVLRQMGHDVCNPATLSMNLGVDAPREEHLRRDFKALSGCDAVFLLPDWEYSEGAVAEVRIARVLKLPIVCAETLTSADEEMLDRHANVKPIERPIDFSPKRGVLLNSSPPSQTGKCG